MQENRLFINGIEMQLSDRTKIGLTLQANDLGSLQSRQGSYTNTFRILLNAYNREQLEQAHVMTSTSQLPYQKLAITYMEGSIEIISNAEGIIQSVDGPWMFIDSVGGNVNLFRSIGDVTIGELFSGQNHFWNFNNVVDSRDGSQFYIYPFIDWRTDETTYFDTPTVDPSKMLTCIREQSVFDQLETHTGYTFTGSYRNSIEHRNGVITPDELSLNPEYFEDVISRAMELDGSLTTDEFAVAQSSGLNMFNSGLFMVQDGPGFFQGSYYPVTSEVGDLRVTGTMRFRVEYDGANPIIKQTKEYWIVVQIKEGGTVLAEKTFEHVFLEADQFHDYVIDVQTGDITLTNPNQYFVNVEIYANAHTNADTEVKYQFLGGTQDGVFVPNFVKFERSPENRIVYGSEIVPTDLFRMKATDVLKDILNLRGLIIQTNAYSKEVSFSYFDDLITNKAISLDWSHLVQVPESKALMYKFGNYGQRNNFKFAENENVSAGLGDSFFNINDTTLEPEVDAVQLNHCATESTPKYLGRVIPEIEAIETSLNVWHDPTWRLLQMETQPTSYNVTYDDGVTSSVKTTNIPFCRFVGFDVLIPENYEALTGILDNTKVLPIVLKLAPDLIQNLDHTIPVELNLN